MFNDQPSAHAGTGVGLLAFAVLLMSAAAMVFLLGL